MEIYHETVETNLSHPRGDMDRRRGVWRNWLEFHQRNTQRSQEGMPPYAFSRLLHPQRR